MHGLFSFYSIFLGVLLFSPTLLHAKKEMLPLAKPYCFLLPPKNSFALECAKKSVKNIVDQYARGGVHVYPVFRWWGNDHSEDPSALNKEAQAACNLEKAFPWAKGTGSIQVFTSDDTIPSKMCGKDPVKDPAAGCSDLCPTGPSFSTVSGTNCGPGVSIHESGHSNCCGSHCHNEGSPECEPNSIDGGCGLCLKGGGQNAFLRKLSQYAANNAKGGDSCQLTEAALASIRQGAVKNPGHIYDSEATYEIEGKQLTSIRGKDKQIKKLEKGVGDPPGKGSNNLAADVPASQQDLKEANPRRQAPPRSTGREAASIQQEQEEPEGSGRTYYTPEELRIMNQ